jgi:hypothetical protein
MALLGSLVGNRRNRDDAAAWNRPDLQGPETLVVTSTAFENGGVIPRDHVGRRVGGQNLSPDLTWSHLPDGRAQLLLVIEDLDVPTSKPAVHCMALIDPSHLDDPARRPAGALSAGSPATGVRMLRSTITRGYHGPEPLKGHGPHRYAFQLFALSGEGDVTTVNGRAPERVRPGVFLSSVAGPVSARGRLTGTYER